MGWKLNKLWTIEYQDGDIIGHILSHVSMIAVLAPIAILCNFLFTKNTRSLRLFIGLILCTISARCIKKVVDSPRPSVDHYVLPGNSGFPSDHSMSGEFTEK